MLYTIILRGPRYISIYIYRSVSYIYRAKRSFKNRATYSRITSSTIYRTRIASYLRYIISTIIEVLNRTSSLIGEFKSTRSLSILLV
jgi:hypothetical protein